MIALLIVLALVALYVAWRIYSAPTPPKPADTQPVTPPPEKSPNEMVAKTPFTPPDTFGEKFPDPKPLKTQTLEEWLEQHPEKPSPQPAQEVETKPEPKTPGEPFLAGKLLPPTPHPFPPVPAVPHVRKRKRKK